jgi:hypothetical protein
MLMDEGTKRQAMEVSDNDGGSVSRTEIRTASPEEKEGREHYRDPEEAEQERQYRDPKVVVPALTQLLMRWSQANPEKTSIIKQAQQTLRAIRGTSGEKQQNHLDELLKILVRDAKMSENISQFLGKSLSAWEYGFLVYLEQQQLMRKAMDVLTKDKNADPTHAYSHREGDDDNPRYYWKDQTGNLVRYTNAPQGSDDRNDQFGEAKIHSGEPLLDKNPEYYAPDGRKLTRVPEDPATVEWNSKYNRYDPKNLWIGRWRDPANGE